MIERVSFPNFLTILAASAGPMPLIAPEPKYRYYKEEIYEVLRKNPYRLAEDISSAVETSSFSTPSNLAVISINSASGR